MSGILKLYTAVTQAGLARFYDRIFDVDRRTVFLGVGLLELTVCAFVLFSAKRLWSYAMLAWVAGCFVAYRGIRWYIDDNSPCGCLGSVEGFLRIRPASAELISLVLLGCLLAIAGAGLRREMSILRMSGQVSNMD